MAGTHARFAAVNEPTCAGWNNALAAASARVGQRAGGIATRVRRFLASGSADMVGAILPFLVSLHSAGHTLGMSAGSTRVALVTGGSRGIGESICRRLAAEGAAVLVGARDHGACTRVADAVREKGGVAWPLALDVTKEESIRTALERAGDLAGDVGPIGWLVNGAGIADSAPLVPRDGSGDAGARRHMEVNYHGPRRLIEALVPGMVERGYGRIVNVASSAGLRGYAYVSAYCASKFALIGYTLAAADELTDSGVTVNAVAPHYVDTDMLERSIERVAQKTGMSPEQARDFFGRQNPGGRILSPGEVAEAVLELLRGTTSGVVLELDGSPEPTWLRPNNDREVAG